MAQTTRFASFGPVLLVVASSVSIRSTVAPRVLVDKNELKKKHVPMAQTTRIASFGPVLLVAAFPEPFRTFNVSIGTVNIV